MIRYARFVVLALGLLLFGCAELTVPATSQQVTAPREKPTLRALRSTVALLRSGASDSVCAGVFVAPKVFVTAHHCINHAVFPPALLALAETGLLPLPEPSGMRLEFVTHGSWLAAKGELSSAERSEGVVFKLDAKHDLATVATEEAARDWVSVRASPAQWDESVFAIGHPADYLFTLSRGHVSMPARVVGDLGTMTQVTTPTFQGNSGGGLFDESGSLLGICRAVDVRAGFLNFFVRVEDVRAILDLS